MEIETVFRDLINVQKAREQLDRDSNNQYSNLYDTEYIDQFSHFKQIPY